MRITRLGMFLRLNALIALILTLYFGRWLFSHTAEATIVTPFSASTIYATYPVNGQTISASFMRNGIPMTATRVTVRYLKNDPHTAVVNSFMGLCAEPLAWWGVFLFASAALLLTNNSVFSKNTAFFLRKRFPWIWMEEYFPVQANRQYYYRRQQHQQTAQPKLKSGDFSEEPLASGKQ